MLFRRALGTTFAASIAASIVIACSGGSGGGGGGGATSSSFSAEFCQIYASNCCVQAGKSADGSQCTAFYDALTKNQQYDATKGQACLDALRARSSAPDFCSSGVDDAACQGVFVEPGSAAGTRKPGETCTEESDCAASPEGDVDCRSDFSNGGETRTCQVQIPGKEGDTPCLGTKDGSITFYSSTGDQTTPPRGFICDVAAGVYCDSTSHACKKVGEIGADCTSGGEYACVKAGYCDFTTHKCVARTPVGGDCAASSTSCAEKSFCDQTTKKCVAGLADGAPCETSQQCASGSCVNKLCDKSSSGDFSTALLCSN
jgi:hypothetical protein